MIENVIEICGLCKIYVVMGCSLGKEVLKGIDLMILCGLIFGLFGFNGVGKFMMINIMVGFVNKIVGLVNIWGFDQDVNLCQLWVVIGVML